MKIDCILPEGFFLSLKMFKISWEPHEEYLLESFTFSPFVGLCNHAENLIISVLLVFHVPFCKQYAGGGGCTPCAQGWLRVWNYTCFWGEALLEKSITNWTQHPFYPASFFPPFVFFSCGRRRHSGNGPCTAEHVFPKQVSWTILILKAMLIEGGRCLFLSKKKKKGPRLFLC